MNDFMLNMALDHFGFDEAQKDRIRGAIPKVAYITQLVRSHRTVIDELIDISNMVAKQIAKTEQQ